LPTLLVASFPGREYNTYRFIPSAEFLPIFYTRQYQGGLLQVVLPILDYPFEVSQAPSTLK
jgi:hypothetical protein